MRDDDISLDREFTERELFHKKVNGIRLIDFLFRKKLINEDHMSLIKHHAEIVDLCIKYNRKDLLYYTSSNLLLNTYVLDTLLKMKLVPKTFNSSDIKADQAKILIKYGRYDLLKNIYTYLALEKVNGKTILEILLEKNYYEEEAKTFESEEAFNVLVKMGRIDLINTSKIFLLLRHAKLNDTYLDLILDYFKKNSETFSIKPIINLINDGCGGEVDDIIESRMIFEEHGLTSYLRKISKDDLFEKVNGKRLIDKLVDKLVNNKNKDKILSVILRPEVYKDIDVLLHFDHANKDASVITDDIEDEFISKTLFDMLTIPGVKLSREAEGVLQQFELLLMDDMEEYALKRVTAWYRYMISKNPSSIELARKIIEIKQQENNKSRRFKYIYLDEPDGSCYKAGLNNISIGYLQDVPTVISHETGHLLHKKLSNKTIPPNYLLVVDELKNDPNFLKRIKNFLEICKNIDCEVSNEVEQNYMKKYDTLVTDKKRKDLEEFLDKQRHEKAIAWAKEKGKNVKYYETLLASNYTVENYLKQEREMCKRRLCEVIKLMRYGYLLQMSDTIDAIFDGKLSQGKLQYNNEALFCFGGHGSGYYYRDKDKKFAENIANYVAVRYSTEPFEKNRSFASNDALSLYRELFGNKFANMIEGTYEQMIGISPEESWSL